VSRKIVTIGDEVFDFLAWKLVGHSFYARRSDGELRAVALIGSGQPLWATPFRCEFPDGTVIGFNAYELSPLSLSEISQLQNVLQGSFYSRKGRPLAAGKRGKPELSAKRAASARKKAIVTYPDDRAKIKNAFLAKTTGKQTNNAAALAVARLVRDDNNPLDLRRGPYKVSADSVKGIAGVKK
jgi:hypothetical protein